MKNSIFESKKSRTALGCQAKFCCSCGSSYKDCDSSVSQPKNGKGAQTCKKAAIALTASAVLLVAFSGCGTSSVKADATPPPSNSNSTPSNIEVPAPTKPAEPTPIPEINTSTTPFPETTPEITIETPSRCGILQDEFSEGLALAAYLPNGEEQRYVGIINQDGQITPVDDIPPFTYGYTQPIKCSPFYEGKCYATIVDDDGENHVYCINADGTSEEAWEVETNATYEYIASGDGVHLFKQSIESYNTDEENILVFDQKSEKGGVFLSPTGAYTYHGEGYFSLMSGVLHKFGFDASDGVVVESTIDANVIPGIENGCDEYGNQATFYNVHNGEVFVLFGSDRRFTQTLYKVNSQGEWSLVLEIPHNTWAVAYGDRVFIFHYVSHNCYTLEIRDLNGNMIFYGDDFYAYDISACSEDAFFLKIYGIDQNMYVTVIDKDGNFAFEPIKMRYAYGQENISRLGEGHFIIEGDDYVFDADFKIVSITGEVVSHNVSDSHNVNANRIQNAIFQNSIAIIRDKMGNGDYLLSLSGDVIIPWYEVVG